MKKLIFVPFLYLFAKMKNSDDVMTIFLLIYSEGAKKAVVAGRRKVVLRVIPL